MSGVVVVVLADGGAGGIIPADKSIAIANARERKRIPRFMLDTFWLARPKTSRKLRPGVVRDSDYPGPVGTPIKKFSSNNCVWPIGGSFGKRGRLDDLARAHERPFGHAAKRGYGVRVVVSGSGWVAPSG
jgi:hypothetical protein